MDVTDKREIDQITADRLLEAELGSLTMRLAQLPADQPRDDLLERRRQLLKRIRPQVGALISRNPLDDLVTTIGTVFEPWRVLRLPSMAERIN